MKLNLSLLSRSLSQPWAIQREQLALMAQLVMNSNDTGVVEGLDRVQRLERATGSERKPRPLHAGYVPLDLDSRLALVMEKLPVLPDGLTVILVWGTLGRGWSVEEQWWLNAVEVDELTAAVTGTPKGSAVVLWFRSPGGISTGIPETAAALRQLGKSRALLAFTDDLCASAAYWLASQCASITATPTARVGSIGVYNAFYDFCEFLAKAGVKLELFKAGSMKGAGLPGNPLSDEEREHIQNGVDECYREFTRDVLRNRRLDKETMQGQCFCGVNAKASNLVDGFAGSAAGFFAGMR